MSRGMGKADHMIGMTQDCSGVQTKHCYKLGFAENRLFNCSKPYKWCKKERNLNEFKNFMQEIARFLKTLQQPWIHHKITNHLLCFKDSSTTAVTAWWYQLKLLIIQHFEKGV